jgi:hypothetical protein
MSIDDELEALLRALIDAQRKGMAPRLRPAFLEDFPVELRCPKCGRLTIEPVRLLSASQSYRFPCGHEFAVNDFTNEIEAAKLARDQSRRDLEK